jgi:hypothetical protein
MKGYRRHKDWSEWGRQRAVYHQSQEALTKLMNDTINSVMSKPYVWNMEWPMQKPYQPFYGGSEMRIPFSGRLEGL